MRRLPVLAGIALRELWFSFRLLAVLGLLLGATLPAMLLPPLAPDATEPLRWLAFGLAAALTGVAAIAAAALAGERMRGTAGWMAVRAVPRSTIVAAWFAAFALLILVGSLPSGGLAWLALDPGAGSTAVAGGFVACMMAAACAGLAAVAAGLLAGAVLSPLAAAATTGIATGAMLLAGAAGLPAGAAWPAGGLGILAGLDQAARPVADAIRSAGSALAASALLLVLAAAALERADL